MPDSTYLAAFGTVIAKSQGERGNYEENHNNILDDNDDGDHDAANGDAGQRGNRSGGDRRVVRISYQTLLWRTCVQSPKK